MHLMAKCRKRDVQVARPSGMLSKWGPKQGKAFSELCSGTDFILTAKIDSVYLNFTLSTHQFNATSTKNIYKTCTDTVLYVRVVLRYIVDMHG